MRGIKDDELRQRCRELRINERLSIREIAAITGAAKGSLSFWLRDVPLNANEKAQKQKNRRSWRKDRGAPSKFYAAIDARELSRSQKGKIAEAAVLFRLAVHGFNIFGPVFDGDRTDWLVQYGSDTPKRIQVRWAFQAGYGRPTVKLTCMASANTMRRFRDDEFDAIVGYDFYADVAYVFVPSDITRNSKSVAVAERYAERWDKLKPTPVRVRASAP